MMQGRSEKFPGRFQGQKLSADANEMVLIGLPCRITRSWRGGSGEVSNDLVKI
jgi:hypothetical protein